MIDRIGHLMDNTDKINQEKQVNKVADSDAIQRHIAHVIKSARLKKNVGSTKLSELLGHSRSWLSDIERCKATISFEDFLKIAYVLDIDLAEAQHYILS